MISALGSELQWVVCTYSPSPFGWATFQVPKSSVREGLPWQGPARIYRTHRVPKGLGSWLLWATVQVKKSHWAWPSGIPYMSTPFKTCRWLAFQEHHVAPRNLPRCPPQRPWGCVSPRSLPYSHWRSIWKLREPKVSESAGSETVEVGFHSLNWFWAADFLARAQKVHWKEVSWNAHHQAEIKTLYDARYYNT